MAEWGWLSASDFMIGICPHVAHGLDIIPLDKKSDFFENSNFSVCVLQIGLGMYIFPP